MKKYFWVILPLVGAMAQYGPPLEPEFPGRLIDAAIRLVTAYLFIWFAVYNLVEIIRDKIEEASHDK